ncbi:MULTISPECIES: cell division protein FtsB [Shewanella]|jgi:cell division protein FtsB|uniref:Cell division protein FtsB n=2 Tax=Shewanella TaxID=22 RepID=A0AAJ1EZE7_9GAMM|nr:MULTISPECIES: cell division protein FtsB [Shewanella]AZQ09723.1 Cell division protein FtsB [Shewanella khirikhana]MCH4293437.1 cell division protein FtsB [Shewanella zhuhaiensis]
MKRFVLVLFALLVLLQYRLWFGDNSLTEYFSLKDKIQMRQQTNAELQERNDVLKEEILDLKSGTEALEERARNELGLIEKGETFFRVVGSDGRGTQAQEQPQDSQ